MCAKADKTVKTDKKVKAVKKVKEFKEVKEVKKIKERTLKTQKKQKNEKMNVFKVVGSYRKGKFNQKFTKEILTQNKQQAEEYLYSVMGSKHRLKRREINIDSIEQIPADQVTNTIIRQMLEEN
jgi:large subunit ribosomal protein LX